MWALIGNTEVGRVREYCTDLQKQLAVTVLVAAVLALGSIDAIFLWVTSLHSGIK